MFKIEVEQDDYLSPVLEKDIKDIIEGIRTLHFRIIANQLEKLGIEGYTISEGSDCKDTIHFKDEHDLNLYKLSGHNVTHVNLNVIRNLCTLIDFDHEKNLLSASLSNIIKD